MFTILSALPAATCHAHHLSEVKQHLLSVAPAKSRVKYDQEFGFCCQATVHTGSTVITQKQLC